MYPDSELLTEDENLFDRVSTGKLIQIVKRRTVAAIMTIARPMWTTSLQTADRTSTYEVESQWTRQK